MDSRKTGYFNVKVEHEYDIKNVIEKVYSAMTEKGYDPVNQIVGYILSEDPTYITNYNNARGLIRKVDRDDLMRELLKSYLGI